MNQVTCVGLDVHARSVVGYAVDARSGGHWSRRMGADPVEVAGWIRGLPGPARATYEAGPTGYGLARFLRCEGIDTIVAAPSKLSRPVGDKVKTDRRDAQLLAQLLQVGQIVAVAVPTEAQEASRDLVRARGAASLDLSRSRQRISKLLLRHGILYPQDTTWTKVHLDWLTRQRFDDPALHAAYESSLQAILFATSRLAQLDTDLGPIVKASPYADLVARLGCLRGISTLTGFGLAVEIGDWHRFTGATIGAYLGMVPSEYSTGASRKQGGITKTGNGHARRLLVEAAWNHRKPYRPGSATMRRRFAAAPAAAQVRGHTGNLRLKRRWDSFTTRDKNPSKANIAIARELAGWCWSLAVMDG